MKSLAYLPTLAAAFLLLAWPAAARAQRASPAPNPPVAEPSSHGWSLRRLGPTEARLTAPDGTAARLAGITPDVEMQLVADPAGCAAVLLRYNKYTDIIVWTMGSGDGLTEVTLPILPAAEILAKYPTAGKPPELRAPRLDSMAVDKAGWGSDRRLAARVQLNLVDDASGSIEWFYLVDVVWSLPASGTPPPLKAVLSVHNVVLRHEPAAPAQ